MSSRSKFAVTMPPLAFWGPLLIIGFFVILIIVNTLFSPPPHTAMYVCATIFVFIPWSLAALWARMLRVKVDGTRISVRKRFGLVRYSFDVSEIAEMEVKLAQSKVVRTAKITVRTSNGRRVSVESPMVNFDKMSRFLTANVDESKTRMTYRAISTK